MRLPSWMAIALRSTCAFTRPAFTHRKEVSRSRFWSLKTLPAVGRVLSSCILAESSFSLRRACRILAATVGFSTERPPMSILGPVMLTKGISCLFITFSASLSTVRAPSFPSWSRVFAHSRILGWSFKYAKADSVDSKNCCSRFITPEPPALLGRYSLLTALDFNRYWVLGFLRNPRTSPSSLRICFTVDSN